MASMFAFWHVAYADGRELQLKFVPASNVWAVRALYPRAAVRKMTKDEIESFQAKREKQARYNRQDSANFDL